MNGAFAAGIYRILWLKWATHCSHPDQQPDATVTRKYWNKLKQRQHEEGSQLVTNCHQLKLTAEDEN